MRFSVNLNQVYQFLFIALVFLFPLTVSGGMVIGTTLIVIWLFSGNYRSKFEQIVSNKLSLACIAFFTLHLVGLLWTEDLGWGLHMVKKMYWLCLGLPILLTITQEDNRQKYLSAFLLAMTFSEICSYLIWFEVIPPFKHASVGNPTPFIDHISYNPLLAFAVYLLLHELLINKGLNTLRRYAYVIFAITMSVNMFITGGRAGHVMYFSMLVIVIFQYFKTRKITAFFTALIVIPMVFFSAYQLSPLFKVRTDSAIHTVVDYLEKELHQSGKDSMTGGRLKRVKHLLEKDENFMMTYGDGVADIDIKALLESHEKSNKLATVTATYPSARFGALDIQPDGSVSGFKEKPTGDGNLINGGYFVLSTKVLDLIKDDSTVWEQEPMVLLASQKQLNAFVHKGFWTPMDTLRDKHYLNELLESGAAPWKTWD